MIGVILGCRPTEAGGDLALPNNRKFLRMFVIQRSLHCATFAICGVVSVFLLYIMNNHLMLPGIDVSGHFVRGLGHAVARLGGI